MRSLLLFTALFSLLAQQPLQFEVASVEVRPKGSLIGTIGGSPSGSRLTLEAMSLSDLPVRIEPLRIGRRIFNRNSLTIKVPPCKSAFLLPGHYAVLSCCPATNPSPTVTP